MLNLEQKIDEKSSLPAKIDYGCFPVPFTYFTLPNRKIGKIEFEGSSMSGSLISGSTVNGNGKTSFVPYGVYARKFFAWFVSYINMMIKYESIPKSTKENIIYLPPITEIMETCGITNTGRNRREFVDQMIAWFDLTISFHYYSSKTYTSGETITNVNGRNRNFARDYHIVLDKDKKDKNELNWVKLDMEGFKILTCIFPLPLKEYCAFSSSLEMDIYSWLVLRISDNTTYDPFKSETKISIPLDALVRQFSGGKDPSKVPSMRQRVLDTIVSVAREHLQNNVHVEYNKANKKVTLHLRKKVYQSYLENCIEKNEIKKAIARELKQKEEKNAGLLLKQNTKLEESIYKENEEIINRGLELALLERAKKDNDYDFFKEHIKSIIIDPKRKCDYPNLQETLLAFEKVEKTKAYPMMRLFLSADDVKWFNRLSTCKSDEERYYIDWNRSVSYTKDQVRFLLNIYLKFGSIRDYEKEKNNE